VDRKQIAISETLNLTVQINEQAMFSAPSFEELKKNFDILSQHKSNRYNSYNGQVESLTEWRLSLGPKREGKLIIPSFEYEGNFSEAIEIEVTAQAKQQAAQDIFVVVELDKSRAHVQEQIIYTQKLYTALSLSSFDPEVLELANARVELLSQYDYQTRLDGRRYAVVELRYAIFPQRSGQLQIPSLRWVAQVSSGRRNVFDPFGNSNSRLHRLQTEAKSLTVLPKPSDANGAWLPASELQLQQSWSQDPDQFTQGEPITRTISIRAKGLTAAQLPALGTDPKQQLQQQLKIYPEQPKLEDDKTAEGIVGQRQIIEAIIPTKPGTITLPALQLRWWNTNSRSWQTSTLAEQTIEVKPNAAASQIIAPASEPALISDAGQPSPSAKAAEPSATVNAPAAQAWFAWGYSLLATLALIGLGFLYWRQHQQLQALQAQLPQRVPAKEPSDPEPKAQLMKIESEINDGNWPRAYALTQHFLRPWQSHPSYQ
ncbi:MAG: BatD family protein, partial [Cellvibrionaceae bacterium]|nr:BatD family protein [Cellvibrionaceae bacterium]